MNKANACIDEDSPLEESRGHKSPLLRDRQPADNLKHAGKHVAERDPGDDAQQDPKRQVALEQAHGLADLRLRRWRRDGSVQVGVHAISRVGMTSATSPAAGSGSFWKQTTSPAPTPAVSF